jgi:hypothetical protein
MRELIVPIKLILGTKQAGLVVVVVLGERIVHVECDRARDGKLIVLGGRVF